MRKFVEIITYLSLAIGISPLSSSILGYNIKLPFLLLGIILLLTKNKEMSSIIFATLRQKNMNVMITILFVLSLFGVVTGGGDLLPVILDFMAIFFFFLFYWQKSKTIKQAKHFLNFVEEYFLAITIYETIVIVTGISDARGVDEVRMINLAICPFFLAMINLQKGRTAMSLIFVTIFVYMTIMSTMRINFFFPILYILFLLYTVFRNRHVSFFRKIVVVGIIVGGTIVAYPIVQSFIEDSGARYLHMVTRTEAMFDKSEEDNTRKNTNMLILEEPQDFLIPQGLGYANHTPIIMAKYRSRYGVMSTMDSNLLYCVYHFGLFIGLGILIMIITGCLKFIFRALFKQNDGSIVMAACFVITILAMFILKSWIFVYSSFGLSYGLLYAYSSNLEKYGNKLINEN